MHKKKHYAEQIQHVSLYFVCSFLKRFITPFCCQKELQYLPKACALGDPGVNSFDTAFPPPCLHDQQL